MWETKENPGRGTAHRPLVVGDREGGRHRRSRRTAGRDGQPDRPSDGLVTRLLPERYFYCYLGENIRMQRQWWMMVKYGLNLIAARDRAHRDRVLALGVLTRTVPGRRR